MTSSCQKVRHRPDLLDHRPAPSSRPPTADPSAGGDALPGVVLLVDDSRFVRVSLARGLSGRFRLQQADSGERAWELLLLDPSIRAVLSDLTMPGIDGFELLARVRGSMLERLRSMPFAVLSGGDDPALRARARSLGADRFEVKGTAIEDLAAWLHERLAGTPAGVATGAPRVDVESSGGYAAAGSGAVEPAGGIDPGAVPPSHGATVRVDASVPIDVADPIRVADPIHVGDPHHVGSPHHVADPLTGDPTHTGDPIHVADSIHVGAPIEATRRMGAADPIRTAAPMRAGEPVDASAPSPVPSPDPRASERPGSGPSPSVPEAASPLPRLVADPLQRWYLAAVDRTARTGDAAPVLIRLAAADLDDLPMRLRRGVRAADALHLEGGDVAYLCLPAAAALAVRLALRFGVLAAGRQGGTARIAVRLAPADPAHPADALAAVTAEPCEPPPEPGLSIEAAGGSWGPAWRCTLPWAAARLLVS